MKLLKSRNFYFFLVISISVFLILTGLYSLRITKISISGISKLNGINIINNAFGPILDLNKTSEILKSENPNVQKISLTYIFPNEIRVKALLNKPVAYIRDGTKKAIIGEDGRVIGRTDKEVNLSEIQYGQIDIKSYSYGQSISGVEISKSIKIIKSITGGKKFIHIDISGNSMILCTIGDKKIFFGGKREIEEEIKDALFMMNELKKEGLDYKTLDVRFLKPIVSVNPYEPANINSD